MEYFQTLENYYDNENYREIVNLYFANITVISKDTDSMYYVIDSFMQLEMFAQANRLINPKINYYKKEAKTRDLTEEELEDLNWFLESRIDILFDTKSFFRLLFFLWINGKWLIDKETEVGLYLIASDKVGMIALIFLIIMWSCDIGHLLLKTYWNIELPLAPVWNNMGISGTIVFFIVVLLIKVHPSRLSNSLKSN